VRGREEEWDTDRKEGRGCRTRKVGDRHNRRRRGKGEICLYIDVDIEDVYVGIYRYV
jgi:hypothetical protein